ncbi:MAG: hypothetical protein ACRC62_13865 [Microcoleus sp.]
MTLATANNDWIKLVRENWFYIRLPKLGIIKVRMHRPIPVRTRLTWEYVTIVL